jgi:hypothetical protein
MGVTLISRPIGRHDIDTTYRLCVSADVDPVRCRSHRAETGQTAAGCFCSRSIQAPSAGLDSKLVISA